jgi:hypothetical protein
VDDRFDRRELLLHLGDVLEAMRHVAGTTRTYSPVAELASREPSLQALPFLKEISPRIRARDFLERAVNAYASWPGALLEPELDRAALASTVRRELFSDDPQGWDSYAAYLRQKVSWFGLEPDGTSGTSTPTNDPNGESAGTSDSSMMKSDTSMTKTRWPWKPIG